MPSASAKPSTGSSRSRLVSVRLPGDLSEQLDRYARTMTRSRGRSELIVQAIEDYLSWRIPQQEEVRAGIAAAERGEFVEHDDVVAWIERTRLGLRSRIDKAARSATPTKPAVSAKRSRKHAR